MPFGVTEPEWVQKKHEIPDDAANTDYWSTILINSAANAQTTGVNPYNPLPKYNPTSPGIANIMTVPGVVDSVGAKSLGTFVNQ
jgi:hypothetical protein